MPDEIQEWYDDEAGPLVRSSYHADGQAALVRELRARASSPP